MTEEIDPSPAKLPGRVILAGEYVTIVPLNPAQHGDALWEDTRGQENAHLWQYLFEGPYPDRASFDADLENKAASTDPFFFAILEKISERAVGRAALMRIEPRHRCIEVGSILYSPRLQRTRGATEAMYLLARYVFEQLNYRRYEWKCDALNEPSRRAALRLGFTFEGVFRQHMIIKGHNRDTAWFSMLDGEWPRRREKLARWLDSANFDENGNQKFSLERG